MDASGRLALDALRSSSRATLPADASFLTGPSIRIGSLREFRLVFCERFDFDDFRFWFGTGGCGLVDGSLGLLCKSLTVVCVSSVASGRLLTGRPIQAIEVVGHSSPVHPTLPWYHSDSSDDFSFSDELSLVDWESSFYRWVELPLHRSLVCSSASASLASFSLAYASSVLSSRFSFGVFHLRRDSHRVRRDFDCFIIGFLVVAISICLPILLSSDDACSLSFDGLTPSCVFVSGER